MGSLVMAAKTTHVPTMWLSSQPGKYAGIRRQAEEGMAELARRATERDVDLFVVADTHWLNRISFHINANPRHTGTFTSHEVPHMISALEYDYPGDTGFAKLLADQARAGGLKSYAHELPSLGLDYATLVPMHFLNAAGTSIPVVSIGANMHSSAEENKRMGEAVARAAAASDRNVAFLASGSLSHEFPDNAVAMDYLDAISDPINSTMDKTVLQLWQRGDTQEFLNMLPAYNARFDGEGSMADTAMLFGALGWDGYRGRGEELCTYFPSTGTGQTIVDFPVHR